MDTLSLQLFLLVAQKKSISAAAEELLLSSSSASARLIKLEEQVGFRLFNRSTRAVSLTSDGETFMPFAEAAITALEEGLGRIHNLDEKPQGLLRITMPGSFGRMHVVPLLGEFSRRYPEIKLELFLSDTVLDMIEGGYDLAIRNAPLPEEGNNIVARRLAIDKRILVASPDYVARRGNPRTPAELLMHQFVVLANNNKLCFQHNQVVTLDKTIVVNDGEAMRLLIENGAGIGIKSMWNAVQSLDKGKLVQVLAEHPLITQSEISLLYLKGRHVPSKVRVMIDFLVKKFQPLPPWEKSEKKRASALA